MCSAGGTFTGNILNSGTITVEGNQSAGIAIDSALAGSLTSTGKVSVIGDNSVGVRTAAVSGNVTIGSGSSTTVQGQNSVGVLLGGDIGGALVIQGTVTLDRLSHDDRSRGYLQARFRRPPSGRLGGRHRRQRRRRNPARHKPADTDPNRDRRRS